MSGPSSAEMKVGDERARPGVLGLTVQREGELPGGDGPAAPGPRVGADLLGGDLHAAHNAVAALGPAGGGVVAGRDLPAGHVPGVGPRVFTDPGQRPPYGRVALGRDREVAAALDRGVRQGLVEVPGVGPHPRPAADLRWQHRQRPGQQLRGVGADVVVAGKQVHGQWQLGLRPARQVHPPALHARVVPPDPVLVAAVDLDVGGVAVDRRVAQHQRAPDRGWHQAQPALVDLGEPCLDPGQRRRGEPAGQPARRRRRRHRRLHQQGAAHISADPVQPGQAVLPGQQPRGHPHQQLAGGLPAVPILHRPDRKVQLGHDPQPAGQLVHTDQTREPRQRRVRPPDPHHRPRPSRPPLRPLGRPLPTSYRCHPAGALPHRRNRVFDNPILAAGQGICHQRHTLNPGLLADLGQMLEEPSVRPARAP